MRIKPENTSNLLDWMYRNSEVERIFSLANTWKIWVEVEIALAEAQWECGIISLEALREICTLRERDIPDLDEFRRKSINVGYPIMELIEWANQNLSAEHQGFLHVGATTQDIMDTTLSVQIATAGKILLERIASLGELLSKLTNEHALTIMPGRTHAQQAVPTTFGLKMAVYLGELTRHNRRLSRSLVEAACISLYGAAGTSAAMGLENDKIRTSVAKKLHLLDEIIPWHASRDRFIEVTNHCASVAVTLVRLSREIIDLARNEIGELDEPGGRHKGASSTMPQKRNPVMSESIVGVALQAIGQSHLMHRAGEVGHERAAGEWQLEWKALPEIFIETITAVDIAVELIAGLQVNSETMRENLNLGNGTIMAEAYMIELARKIGRERAHDLVYNATLRCQKEDIPLHAVLETSDPDLPALFPSWPLKPEDYVGNAQAICIAAIGEWRNQVITR